MEESKRPEAIISLGNRIVEELERDNHPDTLTRWLAHFLAERMHSVGSESDPATRNALQIECCDLIMKIWSRRSSLPRNAQPGGRLKEACDALRTMRAEMNDMTLSFRSEAKQLESAWFAFAAEAYPAERGMSVIAYLSGLLESQIGAEHRWVYEHKEMLTEDERMLIDALSGWLRENSDYEKYVTQVKSKPLDVDQSERNRLIIASIEQRLKQLNDAFLTLREAILDLPTDEHADKDGDETKH